MFLLPGGWGCPPVLCGVVLPEHSQHIQENPAPEFPECGASCTLSVSLEFVFHLRGVGFSVRGALSALPFSTPFL